MMTRGIYSVDTFSSCGSGYGPSLKLSYCTGPGRRGVLEPWAKYQFLCFFRLSAAMHNAIAPLAPSDSGPSSIWAQEGPLGLHVKPPLSVSPKSA